MPIIQNLYILKHDISTFNSIYKVGITTHPPEKRCSQVRRTLKGGKIEVYWHGKFFGAYSIEQTLHQILAPFNVDMPKTVDGHTEFFDLDWLSVNTLIIFLKLYRLSFFLVCFVVGAYTLQFIVNLAL